MEALLSSENCVVQGFLAAGHVCTIMGFAECYKVSIVVTGFEPPDILQGILMTATQLEEGRHEVENQYSRAVRREGNRPAQERIAEVFQITPRQARPGQDPSQRLPVARAFSEI